MTYAGAAPTATSTALLERIRASVIGDDQGEASALVREADLDAARAAVPDGVVEGLLEEEVEVAPPLHGELLDARLQKRDHQAMQILAPGDDGGPLHPAVGPLDIPVVGVGHLVRRDTDRPSAVFGQQGQMLAVHAAHQPLDLAAYAGGTPSFRFGYYSAGTAEATRRRLSGGGVPEMRFERIEGVADREPLIVENPTDPRNRRVSITLLYRRIMDQDKGDRFGRSIRQPTLAAR